jgi:hypothetical protein
MRHRFYFSASHHVVVVVPKLAVAVTIIESSCRTNKTKCGFGGCMKTRMKIHSILTRKPYNTRSGYTYTRQAASLAMMGYDILSKHTKGRRICQFFRWRQKLDRNSKHWSNVVLLCRNWSLNFFFSRVGQRKKSLVAEH